MSAPVTFIADAAPDTLAGQLPVLPVGISAVATCLAAAAGLAEVRTGHRPAVTIRHASVAAALVSERRLIADGQPAHGGFAPASRFWPTADGWVRTHANYPWHLAALLNALGVETEAQLDVAIGALTAYEVQERVMGAGGVAAAVTGEASWRAGAVAKANDVRELIELEAIGDALPRGLGAESALPCAGLRVLDLTRVIAGPVATRMLAALGADVLRVDPPVLPELPLHIQDGLVGKRSTILDAKTPAGRAALHDLVHDADVVVTGYRPGALDLLGLGAEAVAYRHPGTVLVNLSAWGTTGPWGRRRGFDSLVQAASGIAQRCSADGVAPGTLPCQLLDHAAGYLAAAGAMRALARQRSEGGTHGVWVSLARTAAWLLDAPVDDAPLPGVQGREVELQDLAGLQVVPPPGSLDGTALQWPGNRPDYGGDQPRWLPPAD